MSHFSNINQLVSLVHDTHGPQRQMEILRNANQYLMAKVEVLQMDNQRLRISTPIWRALTCPLCKEENNICSDWIDQRVYVSAPLDPCCVCLEAEGNIFLPDCGHVCLCKSCCWKLIEDHLALEYDYDDEE